MNLAVKQKGARERTPLREDAQQRAGDILVEQRRKSVVCWRVHDGATAETLRRDLLWSSKTSNSKCREALAERHSYQNTYKRHLLAHARGARGHRIIGRTPCRDHLSPRASPTYGHSCTWFTKTLIKWRASSSKDLRRVLQPNRDRDIRDMIL